MFKYKEKLAFTYNIECRPLQKIQHKAKFINIPHCI